MHCKLSKLCQTVRAARKRVHLQRASLPYSDEIASNEDVNSQLIDRHKDFDVTAAVARTSSGYPAFRSIVVEAALTVEAVSSGTPRSPLFWSWSQVRAWCAAVRCGKLLHLVAFFQRRAEGNSISETALLSGGAKVIYTTLTSFETDSINKHIPRV
jgi:hypothetical protein